MEILGRPIINKLNSLPKDVTVARFVPERSIIMSHDGLNAPCPEAAYLWISIVGEEPQQNTLASVPSVCRHSRGTLLAAKGFVMLDWMGCLIQQSCCYVRRASLEVSPWTRPITNVDCSSWVKESSIW